MWKTFKKQSPDVKNVFIFDNGEIAVGDAALSSSANQLRNEYVRSIAVKSKAGQGYFTYNDQQNAYFPKKDEIRKIQLDTPGRMINFLSTLGVPFSIEEHNRLSSANRQQFEDTVSGIKESLLKTDKVVTFSTKSLDINTAFVRAWYIKDSCF
jgi:hypothetical protein